MTLSSWLEQVQARVDAAHKHLCEICKCPASFNMSIPVQPSDSDVVLQAPLDDLPKALEIIRELASALEFYANVSKYEHTHKIGDDLMASVELDFFKPARAALSKVGEIVGSK